jgi:putative PIN family toxin of toxin-antitoxin system
MGTVTVVFDTNVIISGAGFGGLPEHCIVRAFEDDIHVLTSDAMMDELRRVVQYDHLPFDEDAQEFIPYVFRLLTQSETVYPAESFDGFDDPDDNKFMECALAGDADYLVSGDEAHVQAFEEYNGVSIVSPRQFLEAVGPPEDGERFPG